MNAPKAIASAIFAATVGNCFADMTINGEDGWLRVGKAGNQTHFINTKSINRGPISKAWFIVNYDSPEEGAASTQDLQYFRCDEQKMALVKVTRYDGKFASGKMLESVNRDGQVPFKEVPPGGIGASMMKLACAPEKSVPPKK